jgi:uncharacterized protein YfaS (alpha-2-macroglobulin family)
MAFHPGETIICKATVKDGDGNLSDPATSMTITITDNHNGIEVNGQDMVKDSVGQYHYDWNTDEDALSGVYRISYKAVDNTRVSIALDSVEIIQYIPT